MFKKALFASAAVMAAGVASAEVTGNFAVTSDYIFRGVSFGQAVQGGLDYAHDSGFYAGTWLSNTASAPVDTDNDGILDANESNDEIDYYVGFATGLSEGLTLDIGFIAYTSDSTSQANLDETYVGISGDAWSATLYVEGLADLDGSDDSEYMYLDLGYSVSTGETTSVDLHAGWTEPDSSTNVDGFWDLSVALNVGDFAIGATMTEDNPFEAEENPQLFVSWGTSFDVK